MGLPLPPVLLQSAVAAAWRRALVNGDRLHLHYPAAMVGKRARKAVATMEHRRLAR
jgi:hypothetical protein